MILGKILERQLFLTLARIGVAFSLVNHTDNVCSLKGYPVSLSSHYQLDFWG